MTAADPPLSVQGDRHMIMLLMTKAEAPLLLVARATRSIRDMRAAFRTRASVVALQVTRTNTVAH